MLATFAVNTPLDDVDAVPGDGVCETAPQNATCTLRAAIMEANALPGPDIVTLGSGVFVLMIPGAGEDASVTGDLDITDELTVQGAGISDTVIQAGGDRAPNDRVFHVQSGVTALLEKLTITGGDPGRRAGGGGVLNQGLTTLNQVRLLSNTAGGEGAGVFNEGTLIALESQFDANSAGTSGGGIYNTATGTVELKDSSLATNTALSVGGGIANFGGMITLRETTVGSSNLAVEGAGIYTSAGSLGLFDSAVAGNFGGGISNHEGLVTILNSTIVNNLGPNGGGIRNVNGNVMLEASSVVGNLTGGGIYNLTEFLSKSVATLVIQNTEISGNDSVNSGGGIANLSGIVTISDSHVVRNTASGFGGGIWNLGDIVQNADLTISGNSSVSENVASQTGGGIANSDVGGVATLTDLLVSKNISGTAGGGLSNGLSAVMTVSGGRVSGNEALSAGGGISNGGQFTLTDSEVSGNEAEFGGGIANGHSAQFVISTSVIRENEAVNGGGLGNEGNVSAAATTIANNHASGVGGGVFNAGLAGVVLQQSAVTGNTAGSDGGGIINAGLLNAVGSSVTANFAPTRGGGIDNAGLGALAELTDTTVADNSTHGIGGGILNQLFATLMLNRVTVSGNESLSLGGGLANRAARTTAVNTTFSGNTASTVGGGIANESEGSLVELINSTVAFNAAAAGGGVVTPPPAVLRAKNTIIANNLPGGDCASSISSQGHNLDSDGSCGLSAADDLSGVDPKLGVLQNNGGPTLTHMLLGGSPAIDSADNVAAPATDQRSVARPADGDLDGIAVADRGAVEVSLDCDARVRRDRLSVSGGRQDDEVRMRDDGQGNILVRCGGGDEAQAVDIRQIILRTGDGNDDVHYTLESGRGRTAHLAPADLRIELGSGSDRVAVAGMSADPLARSLEPWRIDIDAGPGADVAVAELGNWQGSGIIDLSMNLGDGDDEMHLRVFDAVLETFNVDVTGRGGRDLHDVSFTNVVLLGHSTHRITGGSDADEIRWQWDSVSVQGTVTTKLTGGRGADRITVAARGGEVATGAAWHLKLAGNQGDDTLRAEIIDLLLDGDLRVSAAGGAGDDLVEVIIRLRERSRTGMAAVRAT